MLPDFLSSSYDRYKQDTALFTTWLAQVATKCGYKPSVLKFQEESPTVQPEKKTDQPGGGRLKGKERAAAKLAQAKQSATDTDDTQRSILHRYTVTTKELLAQAQAVAKSANPSVAIPAGLRNVIERAIRARQRCAEWFHRSKVQNRYSDEGHLHFIKVLEQSLEILNPHGTDSPSPAQEGAKSNAKVENSTTVDKLANRFGPLNVKDTPHVDDPADVAEVVETANAPKKSKASKGKPVVESYELEDDEEDMAFLIFCFFEDLHRIQDYIKGLWEGFKAGSVSLEIAAVATNAAFDLVRSAEERILNTAPAIFNRKRSWDTIAVVIFYADAFEKGICPETRLGSTKTLEFTEFDDFIYLSTARILMKFTFVHEVPDDADPGYPLPCLPMRAAYISRPELLGSLEMNRKEEEDRVLSQLISDQQLWNSYKEMSDRSGRKVETPMQDEFTKYINTFLQKGVLSVALVFAARVFLDIQATLGDSVGKGYQGLRKMTTLIDKTINLRVVDGAWEVGGTGERWLEKDTAMLLRIKQTSLYWVLDKTFPMWKKYMLSQAEAEGSGFLEMDSDEDVESGTEPSDLHVQAIEPGKTQSTIKKERKHVSETAQTQAKPKPPKEPKFSTFTITTLEIPPEARGAEMPAKVTRKQQVASGKIPSNNAVSRQHRENAKKLDIKRLRASDDLHFIMTSNPVLCGLVSFNLVTDFESAGIALCNWHQTIWPVAHLYNALRQMSLLPKVWPEMEEVLTLHKEDLFSGQAPTLPNEFFTRYAIKVGLSPNSSKSRNGVLGIKLQTTSTTDIFRHYFDQKESLEVCYSRLAQIFQDAQPGSKKRKAKNRPLTDLQFLEKLKMWLTDKTPSVRLDYVTLTRQCAQLLKDIRTRLTLELDYDWPDRPTRDSADQTLLMVVLKLFDDVRKDQPTIRNNRLITPPCPPLRIANEITQNLLRTYRPNDIVSEFNSLPRPQRAPSGLVPNHWNISIRHVDMRPPGDMVFFVLPDAHYTHCEGPIQQAEGHVLGEKLNPKSLATLQVIARLIMKAFVEGMGAGDGMGQERPWSWATNDPLFARRITKVMRDMGVREEALLTMPVAGPEEIASSDNDWKSLSDSVRGLMSRP